MIKHNNQCNEHIVIKINQQQQQQCYNDVKWCSSSALIGYFTETYMCLKRKYMVNASVDFSQSNYYIKKEDVKVEENEKEEEEEEDTNCVNVDDSYNCNGNYQQQQQQQQYIMQRYVNAYNDNNKQQYNNNRNDGYHSYNYKQDNNVKKGWICNKCNHFNYDSRKQCMKCYMTHDGKNIKHNNKKHIHEENYKTNGHNNNNHHNNGKVIERIGDWICINCDNLNFSFRTICNRCQLSKSESTLHTNQPHLIHNTTPNHINISYINNTNYINY